jgi:NAD(P)-dependent dehydrogenase (short-subunit alcohol dehydrogenase family)
MQIQDKTALITGAGRGIGRSTALLFAQSGASVVICSRTEKELCATERKIRKTGGKVSSHLVDVSDENAVKKMIAITVKEYGRLDVLVNNASILGPMSLLSELSVKDWDEVIRINLNGLFYVTRAVLPAMLRRNSGRIINITSSVGRKGRAYWGAYSVSKFGVEGLTQVLADELKQTGIRVMALNPGGTRTGMRAAAYPDEDSSLLNDPAVVARAILYLATSEARSQYGRSLDVKEISTLISSLDS